LDIEKIKQKERNYAKRQITWIRHHYENLIYYKPENHNDVLNQIFAFLKEDTDA
jgi:tRNA A37 N6-isopentenylltransferase MiaA